MYNENQLNELLVPELLDIASELDISYVQKPTKKELVDKILQKQTVMATEKKQSESEKPKRKRIVKGDSPEPIKEIAPAKPKPAAAEKKPASKKPKPELFEEEELQPITSEETTIPPAIAQMLQQEDETVLENQEAEVTPTQVKENKQFDMFIYPNKNHSIYGGNTRNHLFNLMLNFTLEKL